VAPRDGVVSRLWIRSRVELLVATRYEIYLDEKPTGLFVDLEAGMFQGHETSMSIQVEEGALIELFSLSKEKGPVNICAAVRFD